MNQMLPVNQYISHFTEVWEKCPDNLFVCRKYSQAEQSERESGFDRLQAKMKGMQPRNKRMAMHEEKAAGIFFPLFRSFMENIFDYEPDQLDIILSDSFRNVSKDFYYQAREFGPELTAENLYQGLRNVWIMNGVQLKMDLPVEITPSVFAYSMIYPYSDNLLDDPAVSEGEKKAFSQRFNRRLHGEPVEPCNHTEKQLFLLVGMIESQYPREYYPKVYESLYAIQRGQTRSLSLIDCNGMPEAEIREICFEKGGASVLADGYLVAGRLTQVQEQALFGYGIYLQLLDDVQDAREDAEASTKTLFSGMYGKRSLDSMLNRTIHFGRIALKEMSCFGGSKSETMIRLMNRSIEMMAVESAGLNPGSWSDEYLAALEEYSPLRFEFLRQKKSQSKSQRLALFKKYFEQSPSSWPVIQKSSKAS
jgi:hypothetical protein